MLRRCRNSGPTMAPVMANIVPSSTVGIAKYRVRIIGTFFAVVSCFEFSKGKLEGWFGCLLVVTPESEREREREQEGVTNNYILWYTCSVSQ
mmetsp:Transcript_11637/g.24606  ORF Transcript_11637/g.24606 Transcript_11637/m.24606 type:complete len:92 (+) Transcript_11637:1478-1753(+)